MYIYVYIYMYIYICIYIYVYIYMCIYIVLRCIDCAIILLASFWWLTQNDRPLLQSLPFFAHHALKNQRYHRGFYKTKPPPTREPPNAPMFGMSLTYVEILDGQTSQNPVFFRNPWTAFPKKNPCWHSGEKLCQLNRWWAQPPATKCCLKIEPTPLLLNALPGRIALLRLSAESFWLAKRSPIA